MGDLTRNFSIWEFACPCCGYYGDITTVQKLAEALQKLRNEVCQIRGVDSKVHIHSGYRCPKHNKEVGGEKNSQHLYSRAADIHIDGVDIIKEEQDKFGIHTEQLQRVRRLSRSMPFRISPIVLAHYASEIEFFYKGGIGVYSWGCHLDIRGYSARWGIAWR